MVIRGGPGGGRKDFLDFGVCFFFGGGGELDIKIREESKCYMK